MKNIILFIVAFVLALSAFQDLHAQEVDVSNDWGYHYTCDCGCHRHPVNNYSGLNSLKARLADHSWSGDASANGVQSMSITLNSESSALNKQETNTSHGKGSNDGAYQGNLNMQGRDSVFQGSDILNDYLSYISDGAGPLGPPVFVFFKIGSTHLTDSSQIVNLDAIADQAKRWHLKIKVTGAADSVTGDSDVNLRLSLSRAEYVAGLLKQRGVDESDILLENEGGISTYSPMPANRNCRLELFVQ